MTIFRSILSSSSFISKIKIFVKNLIIYHQKSIKIVENDLFFHRLNECASGWASCCPHWSHGLWSSHVPPRSTSLCIRRSSTNGHGRFFFIKLSMFFFKIFNLIFIHLREGLLFLKEFDRFLNTFPKVCNLQARRRFSRVGRRDFPHGAIEFDARDVHGPRNSSLWYF